MYEGHMNQDKREEDPGWEVGMARAWGGRGGGGSGEGKMETTVLEQQLKKKVLLHLFYKPINQEHPSVFFSNDTESGKIVVYKCSILTKGFNT